MEIYPPMYAGDSVFQPGIIPGGDADGVWSQAALRQRFVRSNIGARGEAEFIFDLSAIEQDARAARSAWIGSMLNSGYQALARRFKR